MNIKSSNKSLDKSSEINKILITKVDPFPFMNVKIENEKVNGWYKILFEINLNEFENMIKKSYTLANRKLFFSLGNILFTIRVLLIISLLTNILLFCLLLCLYKNYYFKIRFHITVQKCRIFIVQKCSL